MAEEKRIGILVMEMPRLRKTEGDLQTEMEDWLKIGALSYAKKEGNTIGKYEKSVEMATKLKAKNMSVDEIADVTGLLVEEIEGL